MLTLYLFSLILGGALLLVSLLGGEGGDVDGDVGGGMEGDPGSDLAASKVLSFRSAIYGLFGFGATGAVLTLLEVTPLVAGGAAMAAGIAALAIVNATFGYLRRTDSGALPGDDSLVGLPGRVILPMDRESAGTVVVERAARQIRLRALPHASADSDPGTWTQVVVVEMDGDTARVAPIEGDRLLPS